MKHSYLVALAALFFSVTMSAQIVQVTDINKTDDSDIGSPYAWNDKIYFEANAGTDSVEINGKNYVVGHELYVYDGDTAYLLANFNTDTLDSSPDGTPKNFIAFNDKLYFNADNGKGSLTNPLPYKELSVTDGTTEGSSIFFDADTSWNKQSNPQEMFVFNGKLYAQLLDKSSTQLWATDGVNTPEKIGYSEKTGYFSPSKAIVDSNKVWFKGTSNKSQLFTLDTAGVYTELTTNSSQHAYAGKGILFDDGLLFQCKSDEKDVELWYSDGTTEGTALVLNIATDSATSSSPEQFIAFNTKAYFTVTLDDKTQLWESDATAEGTKSVVIPADTTDTDITNLTVYDNRLFFTLTTEADAEELWAFDGTTTSKIAILGDSPNGFIVVDDILFFINNDDLWCYETTANKAIAVAALFNTGVNPTNVDDKYAVIGSKLYFTGDDLFMIDASTIVITEPALSGFNSLYAYNNEIFFEADAGDTIAEELYKLKEDNSSVLVKNINQDIADKSPNGDPKDFIEYKGQLYFNGNGGDNTGSDSELYTTDGSTDGTMLVYDFNIAPKKGGNPKELFVFNDKLYMQINDGTSTQLWAYDGANTPTKVTSINNGAWATPQKVTVDNANNKVWFQANETKPELFILDQLESVTKITINTLDKGGYLGEAILYNGGLLFQGDNGVDGDELWFSNGTQEGTKLVLDIDTAAGKNSDPEQLTLINEDVFFTAKISGASHLWITDATTEGTKMVSTPADSIAIDIDNLFSYHQKLYFTVQDTNDVFALWTYNENTAIEVKTIGASASNFMIHDDLIFFESEDMLWYSEGTEETTMKVAADLFIHNRMATGVDGSETVSIGSTLYFLGMSVGNYTEILNIDAANIERTTPVTGIFEHSASAENEVNLFPMPTTGVINIESAQSFTSYKVFDLSMKELASAIIESNQINVNLAKGMYILQLEGAETSIAKTIMIK